MKFSPGAESKCPLSVLDKIRIIEVFLRRNVALAAEPSHHSDLSLTVA